MSENVDILAQGSFNQSDSRFLPDSVGKSCTPISCVALCYSQINNIGNWTSCDLDKLITLGDLYYNVSKRYLAINNQPSDFDYFSLDLVYPKVIIDKFQCYFEENIQYDQANNLVHVEESRQTTYALLKKAIESFFLIKKYKMGIFTCHAYSFSLWYINEHFYMFDSHSAELLSTKLVDLFVKQLLKCCKVIEQPFNGSAQHIPFTLTSIKVQVNNDFIDPEAKSLVNLEYKRVIDYSNTILKQKHISSQRQKKLNYYKERQIVKLSLETSQEKEKRLKAANERQKKILSVETYDQRKKRLSNLNFKNRIRTTGAKATNNVTNTGHELKKRKVSTGTDKEVNKQLLNLDESASNNFGTKTSTGKNMNINSLRAKPNEKNFDEYMKNLKNCSNKNKGNQGKRKQVNKNKGINKAKKSKVILDKPNESSKSQEEHSEIPNFIKLRNLFLLNFSKIDLLKKVPNSDNISVKLEAETLINKIINYRLSIVNEFCKYFLHLRKHFESLKLKADEALDLESRFSSVTGRSLHTEHSAMYYSVASYRNPVVLPEVLVLNEEGQVCNIFEAKSNNTWVCNTKYCIIDKDIIFERLINIIKGFLQLKSHDVLPYLNNIDNCKKQSDVPERRGHFIHCYENNNCDSILLFLRSLTPHYPLYRTIVRIIYRIRNYLKNYKLFTDCLEKPELDIEELTRVCEIEIKLKEICFEIGDFAYREESEIIKQFDSAFRALKKKEVDIPINVCISCLKLCCLRNVKKIENIKIANKVWDDITKAHSTTDYKFVCNYCFDKIKNDNLPPTCFLNKLDFEEIPDCMKNLNSNEILFLQRQKAFQKVQRMHPVGFNKNNPTAHLIQKVVGQTFYLFLPFEATVNKIVSPTDPIMKNQELHILVRSIPSKEKKVWQSLVNIDKIYAALKWLKINNIHYKDIILPNLPQKLLDQVEDCVVVRSSQTEDIENQNACLDDLGSYDTEELGLEHDAIEKVTDGAMVTQKNATDKYYENLSVYPLDGGRINEDASTIYQLLKVTSESIDNRQPFLDTKCFPDLFCNGKNGQNEDRPVALPIAEYIKAILMSVRSRFRLSIPYLFFLLDNANKRQVNAGIFTKMNVTAKTSNLDPKKCLQLIENKQLEGNLSTVFSRLRNTKAYWAPFRNDLNCMIDNYGPATFFLTLSPGEYHWQELLDYLCEVNGIKEKKKLSSLPYLIAKDPVSASRFIENKFQAMLDFLRAPNGPLGNVLHYAWRREYQSRGLPHFHSILWVKDAPILGKSSVQEVADFIFKYITCRLPNKENFPTLYDRVTKYQVHHCNPYCLRTKKGKNGKSCKVCRFGFPREKGNNLVINGVAESILARRKLKNKRLYNLPRKGDEVYVNDYNPAVLLAWQGNMDIQYIGEKSSALTTYISKYQTKAEKSLATTDFQDLLSTKSLYTRLYHVAMKGLLTRECGTLEAADTLLQIALFGTDNATQIRWLDVKKERARKIKPKQVLEQLNDDGEVFCESWIDTHYGKRPVELEEMSLFDFSRWFDTVKQKPKSSEVIWYPYGKCYLRKRKTPYLINHYKFNPKQEPEKYYYSLLLLFEPWRDTKTLKNDLQTYKDAFDLKSEKLETLMRYHERLVDIRSARDELSDEVEKMMTEFEDKVPDENDDNLIVDNDDIMQEIQALQDQNQEQNLEELITNLNVDQKKVFDNVIHLIKEYISDMENLSSKGNRETLLNMRSLPKRILREFVSGVGGTGKSYLIKVISLYVKQVLQKQVIVSAPTGIAAYNVNGVTLHRLLQLPIEHDGVPKYKRLSDAKLAAIRNDLKDVVLLIIDEISMVSNVMLSFIHLRLTEIFDTSELLDGWFGRLNILCFGDLLQLPPVNEASPFLDISKDKCKKYFSALLATNLWRELFSYNELTINVRQQSDNQFADILSSVRLGVLTDAHEKILRSREIVLNAEKGEECIKKLADYINKLPANTVSLFPTRKLCVQLNNAMLAQIDSPEVILIAEDEIEAKTFEQKEKAKKSLKKLFKDETKTAGIESEIKIKIRAKIMLLRNLDISVGLVNGAIGTVKKFIHDPLGNKIIKMVVEFSTGEHELEPAQTKFQLCGNAFIIRKQFPVCLAYGITIHKSQGLTLDSCVVEVGNPVFTCGQGYVAMSRVKAIDGLHIINLNPANIKAQTEAIIEYNRLRKLASLDLPMLEYTERKNKNVKDRNLYSKNNKVIELGVHVDHTSTTNVLLHNFKQFVNEDGVSCYANAALQCLVNKNVISAVVLGSPESALKSIFLQYHNSNNCEKLTCYNLRNEFAMFRERRQQDASEFLQEVFEKYYYLKPLVEARKVEKCECSCGYVIQDTFISSVCPLLLPTNMSETYTIDNIIAYNFYTDSESDKECPECAEKLRVSNKLENYPEVLIFSLQLGASSSDGQSFVKNKNLKLSKIPTSIVKFEQTKYYFSSAIFHHGNRLDSGHYTAVLKYKSGWFKIDDDRISQSTWPRNSKDIYILMYTRPKNS